MSSYLSAFGVKRTWRDRRWRIDRSLMTVAVREGSKISQCSGTRRAIPFIREARELLGSETARVHRSTGKRSRVAARGARAAAGDAGNRFPQREVPKRLGGKRDSVPS